MSDRELYQQTILEHNNKPRNEGMIEDKTHYNKSYNPFCGDEIEIYLKIQDNMIVDIKHNTMGCSISRASASMMTEWIKGGTIDETRGKFLLFQQLVKGDIKEEESIERMGKLSVFSGIWNYPARIKCAMLAWHAMLNAIDGKKENIIEEK